MLVPCSQEDVTRGNRTYSTVYTDAVLLAIACASTTLTLVSSWD